MAREEAPRRREKASDIPDATTPRRPVARRKTSGDSSGTPAGLKDVSDPDASAERPSASGGGSRRRPRRRRGPREARAGKERTMLVHADPDGTQIAVLEGGEIVEHYVTRVRNRSLAGNVYLGRVQNVLPGMEASFVDIGEARDGAQAGPGDPRTGNEGSNEGPGRQADRAGVAGRPASGARPRRRIGRRLPQAVGPRTHPPSRHRQRPSPRRPWPDREDRGRGGIPGRYRARSGTARSRVGGDLQGSGKKEGAGPRLRGAEVRAASGQGSLQPRHHQVRR